MWQEQLLNVSSFFPSTFSNLPPAVLLCNSPCFDTSRAASQTVNTDSKKKSVHLASQVSSLPEQGLPRDRAPARVGPRVLAVATNGKSNNALSLHAISCPLLSIIIPDTDSFTRPDLCVIVSNKEREGSPLQARLRRSRAIVYTFCRIPPTGSREPPRPP